MTADRNGTPDAKDDTKDPTQQPTPGLEKGGLEEQAIRDQQHTGNHHKPGDEAGGADRRGGTRAGAENVEPVDGPVSTPAPDSTPDGGDTSHGVPGDRRQTG